VWRHPGRLLVTLLVTFVVFAAWDVYAIHADQWTFSHTMTTGLLLPGRLPIEEALFFVVIPICIILTFETVRRVLSMLASRNAPVDAP
jgi:lycopene cyclase domain-containing protein